MVNRKILQLRKQLPPKKQHLNAKIVANQSRSGACSFKFPSGLSKIEY